MEMDDIYRDEESTADLSQLQGRPSLRLASLPSTPPPPTPLKYRDTNTLGNSKQWRSLHSRRGLVATARTAPTSPTRSRPRAADVRRPLTPTFPAAPPLHRPAMTEADEDDVNSNSSSRFPLVCDVPVAGGTNERRVSAGDGEGGDGGEEEEEESLAQSSRWVSFSFASALTSRRQSESRPSSPSPQPRAAIIPSNFPNLHLSEDECTMAEGVDATTRCSPTPTTPLLSLGRPPVVFNNTPEEARENEEEEGDGGEGRPIKKGRESLLLTSAPFSHTAEVIHFIPTATAGVMAFPVGAEGLPTRQSRGKRERSALSSSLTTSFVLCGTDSLRQGAAEPAANALGKREDDVMDKAMWPNTDSHLPRARRLEETTNLEESVERSILSVASTATMRQPMPTAEGGESLVLVDGPTPTPWRRRLAPVVAAAAENKPRGSMVLDVRCSDAAVLPVALFADAPAGGSEGGRSENADNERAASHDTKCCDATGMTACEAEDVTRMEKTVRDGCGVVDEEHLAMPDPIVRPSEELKALIESAREEVRRASKRILAALHAHRCASCDKSDCVQSNGSGSASGVADDDSTWIGDSPQLAFGRSLTGPSGDGAGSPWISKDTVELRRDLAAHAGCILRRLRGYDPTDAGILSLAVVTRVVRLVLFNGAAADALPVCRSEGSANLSWGLASPSSVCSGTPERKRTRQEVRAAEESAMELCMRLWRCFREHFGERNAARRFGICEDVDAENSGEENSGSGSQSPSHAFATCFPRVRLQLGLPGQPLPPSPPLLDTRIDYNVFAASLAELN
ncbi:hypothetical protein MOQ_007741 [Trypanosoma cruzi marinkellei]|uniref:Uncharacterized protein n=1 Tax=Trypanosoma cruzi marinkellei TaxID=85056 RepID=K2MS68_TRYCR|nr:hypothetical protein MOQ_007741 [Trypanosoma cruzi marinkellei]